MRHAGESRIELAESALERRAGVDETRGAEARRDVRERNAFDGELAVAIGEARSLLPAVGLHVGHGAVRHVVTHPHRWRRRRRGRAALGGRKFQRALDAASGHGETLAAASNAVTERRNIRSPCDSIDSGMTGSLARPAGPGERRERIRCADRSRPRRRRRGDRCRRCRPRLDAERWCADHRMRRRPQSSSTVTNRAAKSGSPQNPAGSISAATASVAGTRDGTELGAALSVLLRAQAGIEVDFGVLPPSG